MTYLALARKWRPRTFAELVGQEHVVRALRNALDTGRVHHAFLFTGTRGVGKTTIARIFAKSLNCETGVSSEPCGQCAVCREVDAGRFVDLVEIDAASHTGVDDVRELIESAQFAPARGRYKVFLIDEVHMLSRSAFNALLKTLEEPPGHVRFLLATTDPQKLPVTVLSRCLQFNLRRLREEEIAGQMTHILAAEEIAAAPEALALLAHAADGSLRDALSLLDQAIAHGGGAVQADEVRAMLGTLDQDAVLRLLEALAAGDGSALYAAIEAVAAYVVGYDGVLDSMAAALHQVQLRQVLPQAAPDAPEFDPARIAALAAAVAAEDVQVWYQIAINGSRDVALAPTPRIGFEMSLLRMLAFRPDDGDGD
ncbi:MAG: DNA polymerase III subunit gamma/tau, partial [Pseudoxanthomonas sp.]|nr:DNA polymerase III subunit gamma/tau [Pseudoxanthomonas sp.]